MRKRQTGAAAIFAALGLLALISATALAIDLGQLYLAKRDLQRIANTAALDTATAAGGCLAPERDRVQIARQQALSSIGRNGGQASWLEEGGSLSLGRSKISGALREFVALADPNQARAVELVLSRPLPPRILQLPGRTELPSMSVIAAAQRAPLASFVLNPSLVDADALELQYLLTVVNSLAGRDTGLDVAALQTLVDTVTPLDTVLPPELIDQIVFVPGLSISVTDFLLDIANSLFGTLDEVAQIVQDIATSSDGLNELIPADIISIPPEYDQLGEVLVPVFELVRAALQAAGGSLTTLLPPIEIPLIDDATVTTTILRPARLAPGPAQIDSAGDYASTVRSAQARINVTAGVGEAFGAPIRLGLELEVAPSVGELQRIYCASRDRQRDGVLIGVRTGAADLRLNDTSPVLDVSIPVTVGVIDVPVRIQVSASGQARVADPTTRVLEFSGPFARDSDGRLRRENSQDVGASSARALENAMLDLSDNMVLDVSISLPALDPVLRDAVMTAANDLVQGSVLPQLRAAIVPALLQLDDQLLLPLSGALGVRIPNSRVTVTDVLVPRPVLIRG